MEQLLADARRSAVNLAKTWLEADIERRHEIQAALFPDGLRFSPDLLFFEPRNHTLMQAVSELVTHQTWSALADDFRTWLLCAESFEPALSAF